MSMSPASSRPFFLSWWHRDIDVGVDVHVDETLNRGLRVSCPHFFVAAGKWPPIFRRWPSSHCSSSFHVLDLSGERYVTDNMFETRK